MKKNNTVSAYTILGLCFVFILPPLVLFAFQSMAPASLTDTFVITRELSLFLVTGILILIIVKGERLSLKSIGLHGRNWGKSILWSLLTMVAFIAVVMACLTALKLAGVSYGASDGKYVQVSLWVMSLMMLRAAVFEEIFYRGYSMERLFTIKNHWLVYFLLPSLIFGLMHFRQGVGGVVIATAGGLVLSFFYWKRRDLKSNILAHFLVDFIPNILVPLIAGES